MLETSNLTKNGVTATYREMEEYYNSLNWKFMFYNENYYNFITSCYGWRILDGADDAHEGVDFATNGLSNPNSPLLAATDGKVVRMLRDSDGRGYCIIVETFNFAYNNSNKLYFVYMHMKDDPTVMFSIGQSIKTGDIVGYVGNTGGSTGEHLHISILIDVSGDYLTTFNTTVNPMMFYLYEDLNYDSL